MGYVQNNLAAGERIVYRTRLHRVILVWPLVFLAISLAGSLFASSMVAKVLPALALLAGLWPVLVYFRSELAVTNSRVFGKTGFSFSAKYPEVSLVELRDAEIKPGILSKLFDYGAVVIIDARGARHKFAAVPAPFYQHVRARRQTMQRVLG